MKQPCIASRRLDNSYVPCVEERPGGGNQTGGSQSLASGRSRYSAASDDKAVEIEKNIKAESDALSRKGNVVQVIRRSNTGGGGGQRQQQSSQAGSGSYYASRFG